LSGKELEPAAKTYRNPALTVDGVVLVRRPGSWGEEDLSVLLVKRGRDPFKGAYALPGGFVDYGEDPDDAVNRELAEETGLTGIPFQQFRVFGKPDRDPRGHTVSIVYYGVLLGDLPTVVGGDDAIGAEWFPVRSLPRLAFDHAHIVAQVLRKTRIR